MLFRMTGIRVWTSRTNWFGSALMIVQVCSHLPFAGIFPALLQSGKHEWRIVLHADRIRNFAAPNFLPFAKAIDWDQARFLNA
jgi:hypothetical protein